MPLTPDDVVNKRFNQTKFREGYDQDEVDDFLDEVVAELRRLNDENEQLRSQLSQCEGRVAELSRGGAGATEVSRPVPSVPAPPQPVEPLPSVIPAAAAADNASTSDVAGMLALAQRLHDEHVRNGQEQRDKIVGEAQATADRLVREAEEKQRQTLGSLEQERSLLERKIDELRSFEREYRSRLKSYLENQLRELDNKGQVMPNRTPVAAGAAAGPQPIRNAFQSADDTNNVSSGFPFGQG
jgi:DivIVA domain-containing protein